MCHVTHARAERLLLNLAPGQVGPAGAWAVGFGPGRLLASIDRLMGLAGFRAAAEGQNPPEPQTGDGRAYSRLNLTGEIKASRLNSGVERIKEGGLVP
jgi:hypothetical protein